MKSKINNFIEKAILHFQNGNLSEAESFVRRVFRVQPNNFDALHMMGVISGIQGRHLEAKEFFEKALKIYPDDGSIRFNLAKALSVLDRDIDSLPHHAKATQLAPRQPEAWLNYGKSLNKLGKNIEALTCYDSAIALNPNNVEALNNRGVVLKDLGRNEEALVSFEKALAMNPHFAEAWSNKGNTLRQLKRLEEALTHHDQAIQLNPNAAIAWANKGLVLYELQRYDEALAHYDRAIAIQPEYAEAYCNRGNALHGLKQLDAAMNNYDKAISIKSDYADAHWNKSLVFLLEGNFERGWELYEWRRKRGKLELDRKYAAKEWEGERLSGSLLVLPEQGLGDEIFYSGMLNDLTSYAAKITVCVDSRLLALYERSFHHLAVISKESLETTSLFDAQIYMASLGRYFRSSKQALNCVKASYLRADPERVRGFREKLTVNKKIVCGLSWISKNKEFGEHKSLTLMEIRPLLDIADVEFVNLQYGDTGAEQVALATSTGIHLADVAEVDNLNDIDGLAALIGACDVVVTVSNTTAHLAAALGKRVLIMLPYSSGLVWYWHEAHESSPWYPTAKLFRQDKVGRWDGVIDRVRQALQQLVKARP